MWLIRRTLVVFGLIAFMHCATSQCRAEQPTGVARPSSVFTPAETSPSALQPSSPSSIHEIGLYKYYGLAIKLLLFMAVIFGTCLTLLIWRRRMFSGSNVGRLDHRLQVIDSVTIAPGINVKLIHVGSQRVLVGHDRHGLKELLLIHKEFEEIVATAEQVQPQVASFAHHDAQLQAHTLANPKDDGWDLNRLTI